MVRCRVAVMRSRVDDERLKQVIAGAGLLLGIALLVCGALIGWRHVPGWAGEWLGTMIGVMTTPFFMEASFVVLGLVVVVALNGWRRKRSGEDFVYLEEVDGADGADRLPEHAKWAVYSKKPLAGVMPTLCEQAEGALAIGDFEQATECIAAMDADELRQAAVLEVRLALARASGREGLAAELEAELAHSRGAESNQVNIT